MPAWVIAMIEKFLLGKVMGWLADWADIEIKKIESPIASKQEPVEPPKPA